MTTRAQYIERRTVNRGAHSIALLMEMLTTSARQYLHKIVFGTRRTAYVSVNTPSAEEAIILAKAIQIVNGVDHRQVVSCVMVEGE